MNIYIKDMVCVRCKMAVQTVLENLGIPYLKIELGKVTLTGDINKEELLKIIEGLRHFKLELMNDKKKILVERIKTTILQMFHSSDHTVRSKFSEYLSKNLFYDYTYLANTFSEIEGSTIEKYYITKRIERVKELMIYEEMTITEIAYQLNFSNVAHLSQQFKKVTGQTPLMFKKLCESNDFVWKTC